jgi:hypothetical protein
VFFMNTIIVYKWVLQSTSDPICRGTEDGGLSILSEVIC